MVLAASFSTREALGSKEFPKQFLFPVVSMLNGCDNYAEVWRGRGAIVATPARCQDFFYNSQRHRQLRLMQSGRWTLYHTLTVCNQDPMLAKDTPCPFPRSFLQSQCFSRLLPCSPSHSSTCNPTALEYARSSYRARIHTQSYLNFPDRRFHLLTILDQLFTVVCVFLIT